MLREHAPVAGFNVMGSFENASLVEIAQGYAGRPSAVDAGEAFFQRLGKETARVADSTGMVLGRIVAAIANEGLTALGEGLATREAIDTAVRLGANHPLGPLEWADKMGLETIYHTLRTLQTEYGDAYTPSMLLRRLVQTGASQVP